MRKKETKKKSVRPVANPLLLKNFMCLSNERTFPYSQSSLDPDLGRRLISTARLRNYRPTLRVKKIMGKESTKGLGVTKTLTVIKQLSHNPLVFGGFEDAVVSEKSRVVLVYSWYYIRTKATLFLTHKKRTVELRYAM